MPEPRELVAEVEQGAELPIGNEERFAGYGVMGLPFTSGHILGLRRWPASSLGKGYTSVWHRNSEGQWTFIQDAPPQQACSRYFGSAVAETLMREIEIVWSGPHDFTVKIDGDYDLNWQVSLAQTLGTGLMNAAAGVIPSSLWRNITILKLIGRVGSFILGTGRLGLTGHVPNGQRFVSNPRHVWAASSSETPRPKVGASWRKSSQLPLRFASQSRCATLCQGGGLHPLLAPPRSHSSPSIGRGILRRWRKAILCGQDLGKVGPLSVQASLGDVWIPQRGRFFIGYAFLEAFDSTRHLSTTSQKA